MSETYKWLVVATMLFNPGSVNSGGDTVTVEQLKREVVEIKQLKQEVVELNRIVDSAQNKRK